MTSVSSTNSTTSTTSSSSSTSTAATTSLLANYDTFLTLLTTQLKTQNPLDPMDADKFTEQLVQYSSVEQQIQTNEKLDSMLASLTSNAALQLVNYVGKEVTAYSDTTQFNSDKEAKWTLTADEAVTDASVTITNSSGAVVYSGTTDLTSGENTYTWDGKGTDGTDWSSSDDSYTLSISGTDTDGKAVDITTQVTGTVDRVDTSGSQPYLEIDGNLVPLSSLISIGS